jgi:ubiquitin-protein ligase
VTDPLALRLAADRERLAALAAASGGRIVVLAQPTPVRARFELALHYPTAPSAAYPRERQETTRLAIELPERYPFQPPVAVVSTPIHHPNVFASGLVCLGAKWLPSEGMDLFVQRLIRLFTFDPLLVNVHSVANAAALHWYLQAVRQHPDAFPSERVAFAAARQAGGVRWQEAAPERVRRDCPHCGAGLRLPAGRHGSVRCPRCGADFEAAT